MQVAFLFGAGVGIPAGLPSTERVTARVLSGRDVVYVPADCRFFCSEPGSNDTSPPDDTVTRVTRFLELIRRHWQEYFDEYQKPRTANYEDLYYAVAQISDHVGQEYENPAIEPFVRKIAECAGDEGILDTRCDVSGVADLADKAASYPLHCGIVIVTVPLTA